MPTFGQLQYAAFRVSADLSSIAGAELRETLDITIIVSHLLWPYWADRTGNLQYGRLTTRSSRLSQHEQRMRNKTASAWGGRGRVWSGLADWRVVSVSPLLGWKETDIPSLLTPQTLRGFLISEA